MGKWSVKRDIDGIWGQTNNWVIQYWGGHQEDYMDILGKIDRIYSYSTAVKIKNILMQQLKKIEEDQE